MRGPVVSPSEKEGEEPMTGSQHAHRTTKGGLADSIASRIPLGHAGIFDFIQDLSCVQLPQNGANLALKKAKIGPTTRPDGVQRRQNRAKLVKRRGQNHENVGKKKQRNKEEGSTPQHRPTLG